MLETICRDCGQRYPLGQDHTCTKKPSARKHAAAGLRSRPADAKARGENVPKIGGSTPSVAPKSTAARKDVPASPIEVSAKREASAKRRNDRPRTIAQSESRLEASGRVGELATPPSPAGTQAPPVDTPLTKRGTPRKRAPKGTFDKTAYQRELMARRRKAQKEGRK